jgi:hypothetical protein
MEEESKQEHGAGKAMRKIKKMTLKRILLMMSKMKKGTFVGAILLLVLIGSVAFVYFMKKSWFIAATVNGTPVSRVSVIQELEKQGGKSVLDDMIMKMLIRDEVHRLKIVIKRSDIDAEIKTTESQVTSQGGTLDEVLEQQGMTRDDLTEQVLMKKQLEQILADKIQVSDEEINQYLKEHKINPTKDMSLPELKNKIQEQLQSTKFSTEVQKLIVDLRESANIVHYVEY